MIVGERVWKKHDPLQLLNRDFLHHHPQLGLRPSRAGDAHRPPATLYQETPGATDGVRKPHAALGVEERCRIYPWYCIVICCCGGAGVGVGGGFQKSLLFIPFIPKPWDIGGGDKI